MVPDGLKGAVFEMNLANLKNDKGAFRKFMLIIVEAQGEMCLTNFHSMDLIDDKMGFLVKKMADHD